MKEESIVINNIQIPIVIKSFKTSKTVKIFFKNDKITITKPTRFSFKNLTPIIKKNEQFIYDSYLKGLKAKEETIKNWRTGETIQYKGEEYKIIREVCGGSRVKIEIFEKEKLMNVRIPNSFSEEDIKYTVDKGIKRMFRNNTEVYLQDKLPYWSAVTGIVYNSYAVRDAKTRYGSCVKRTKALRFSSRLIMLPPIVIDAIIVHELCHIIHANHSKEFYDLVEKYMPNYRKIDRWLKRNSANIII